MNVCRFSFNVYFNQSVIPLTIKPSRNPSSNQPVLWPSHAIAYSHGDIIWDEHPQVPAVLWWTIGFWPIAQNEPRGCPADVEVNKDLLRSGGPPPPARGAPRAELDEYIRRKWAAKLRDQDDQGRAKAWVMFSYFCFFLGCFKNRCLPQNLDVWDWSKTMWISTNIGNWPTEMGKKKGFWLKRSGVDHEKVNFDL